jgi:hypothetical protein
MVSFGYLFHDSKRTPITDAYTIKEALGMYVPLASEDW